MHGDNPIYTSILSHSHFPHPHRSSILWNKFEPPYTCLIVSSHHPCAHHRIQLHNPNFVKRAGFGVVGFRGFILHGCLPSRHGPFVKVLSLGCVSFFLTIIAHLLFGSLEEERGEKKNLKKNWGYVRCSTKNYSGGK